MADTIYALSSGSPPAAIAIIRISGTRAQTALRNLAGHVPPPRRASVMILRGSDGEALDRALVLWMPGPTTATGEDLVELHCHGGRAVVAAVEDALALMPGLRKAVAGEFTRRAFEHGRMDLNAVEGLSDLLAAETQTQRRAALAMAEGHFSHRLNQWRVEILQLAAMAEAALDFSDEDDVPDAGIETVIGNRLAALIASVEHVVAAPSAERLRDGIRVVLAGPPNAGKSTLLNALVGREAAIVSDIAGTTRDRIEVSAAVNGTAFLFTDTAGLRAETDDAIEAVGMDRARAALDAADIILWLGDERDMPRDDAILVAAQADRRATEAGLAVSALTGMGMNALVAALMARARTLLPGDGDFALHQRQRHGATRIRQHLHAAAMTKDVLIVAEELRLARQALDDLTGRAGTEDMLDALFSGFCIGK